MSHLKKVPLFIALILSLCSNYSGEAQLQFGAGFGGQIGISFGLGTHMNRIGAIAKLYYAHQHFQINWHGAIWFYGQHYATNQSGWEAQIRIGAVGSWGRNDSIPQPFVNEVGNQTHRRNSAGFSYNFYFNNVGTSQRSGTIGLQFGRFRFAFENDFLDILNWSNGFDRYRTGAIGLYYSWDNIQIGLVNMAWTGDPYLGAPVIKNPDIPARFGYKDMRGAPYAQYSMGSLALQVEYRMPYGQYFDLSLGIDADQIRNAFQNKFIHDSPILPINWGKVGNPHIPMVDAEGKPFIYAEGQKVRPAKFFMQLGLNNTMFY